MAKAEKHLTRQDKIFLIALKSWQTSLIEEALSFGQDNLKVLSINVYYIINGQEEGSHLDTYSYTRTFQENIDFITGKIISFHPNDKLSNFEYETTWERKNILHFYSNKTSLMLSHSTDTGDISVAMQQWDCSSYINEMSDLYNS